jgi:hypothetical protein
MIFNMPLSVYMHSWAKSIFKLSCDIYYLKYQGIIRNTIKEVFSYLRKLKDNNEWIIQRHWRQTNKTKQRKNEREKNKAEN